MINRYCAKDKFYENGQKRLVSIARIKYIYLILVVVPIHRADRVSFNHGNYTWKSFVSSCGGILYRVRAFAEKCENKQFVPAIRS